ncbi:MAG: MSEP-CTERM sorting domain-containing protein [Thermoclostridium sp.]|nr:MSEP-CTERM sorting domain-containing protein [Thermoclostridium sp.]
MQTIRKPIWVFLTITLPQIFILAVLGKIFSIISPLMNTGQVADWYSFGAVILLFIASTAVYAIVCLVRKMEIVPWFGLVVFSVCVPLVYASIMMRDTLIPSSVPSWMMFDLEPVIVLEALTVPALAYAMLLSVFWLTPKKGETKLINDAVLTICIPFAWYLFFVALVPMINGSSEFLEHTLLIVFILSSIAFLFFLTRMVFIFLSRKPDFWKKLILPFVLIFPLLGLTLNLFTYGPFGNFSHPGFFIAAAICGALLILPEWEKPKIRLMIFLGKMFLFPYTVYFFLIFLPYMPIAIPAIIAVGSGFLILTPIFLFLIHIRSLHIDLCYLRQHYNQRKALAAGVLLTLVLPLSITALYYGDRVNLAKAMTVAVNPSYQEGEPVRVNRNGIRRTLDHVEQNKTRDDFILPVFSQQTPLLSAWYRFIVTDNLVLSSDKQELIRRVILGESPEEILSSQETGPVQLQGATVESTYDTREKVWRSWVHLTLKNSHFSLAEYKTDFKLPEGCYVSNYYLVVEGEKKYGLLADKRAAEWIYRQITTIRRDPGLLRYIGNNRLGLRVFPFSSDETRLTGFEIIHKEPAVLSVDGNVIELAGERLDAPIQLTGAVYLPAYVKEDLQTVTRKNDWFFLIDISDSKKADAYLKRTEAFVRQQNLALNDVHVLAVNDNVWKVQAQNNALKVQKGVPKGGGFYADKAIKTILYKSFTETSPTRPVIVLVTNNLKSAIIRDDLDLWQAALPEGNELYHLDAMGDLFTYNMQPLTNQTGEKSTEIKAVPVIAWPNPQNPQAYMPNNGEAEVISMADSAENSSADGFQTSWEIAVLQQAEYLEAVLHPENKTENQFNLVRGSIASGILSPYTAYIVLENEAQENMLKEKQKQILAAKSDYDLGENLPEETVMSEPGLIVMAVLFMGALLVLKRKARKIIN